MDQANPFRNLLGINTRKNAKITHKGGIDNLQPGQFSGWVIAEGLDLHEVRLLVGNVLIARTEINQPRADVSQKFDWVGQPGFTVELTSNLPIIDWQFAPRVIALSSDGSQQVELSLLGRGEQTSLVLKTLLQSDLIGLIGHCDGLVTGCIRGWAGRKGQAKPATIWLQAHGENPIQIVCDLYREGMQRKGLPSKCGFEILTNSLPASWGGCSIWFSFDLKGEYRLPQSKEVIVPGGRMLVASMDEETGKATDLETTQSNDYLQCLEQSPTELLQHWRRLEELRIYFDNVEKFLDQLERESALATQTLEKRKARRLWWPILRRH